MFNTYYDDSIRFTSIMDENPMVLFGVIAINALSIMLSIAAILWLDLSWLDIVLGLLTAVTALLAVGAAYAVTAITNTRFMEWTESNLGLTAVLGTVLLVLCTTLSFSLFIGLPAALAVVVVPAIITSPMVWVLRRWALRTY